MSCATRPSRASAAWGSHSSTLRRADFWSPSSSSSAGCHLNTLALHAASDESPSCSLNRRLSPIEAGGIHVTMCLCTLSVSASSCAFHLSAWGSQFCTRFLSTSLAPSLRSGASLGSQQSALERVDWHCRPPLSTAGSHRASLSRSKSTRLTSPPSALSGCFRAARREIPDERFAVELSMLSTDPLAGAGSISVLAKQPQQVHPPLQVLQGDSVLAAPPQHSVGRRVQ